MKKNQISQVAFVALLVALGMPFLVRNSGDNIKLGNISISRVKHDLFTRMDYLRDADIPTNMMLVLVDEVLNSKNPFAKFSDKLKFEGFGLSITEEEITAKIQSDKRFIMFGRFHPESYNTFLRRYAVTDPMYRDYVRQYMAAELLLNVTDNVIENMIDNMSEYIANIHKAFRQRRTVSVRKVQLEALPQFDITQADIEKIYVENQQLFKTAVQIKVEALRCNITKEKKMLLGDASRGGDINNMSISDIAKVLNESVINIDIHGDSTIADIDINKHVLDQMHDAVIDGHMEHISFLQDGNITYIYKIAEYKKSEVNSMENVKQTVIDMATKEKQREYCEKHMNELMLGNKQEFTFALTDILPKGFMGFAKGPTLEKEGLDIARTAFQLSNDTEHKVKFIISHGQVFLIGLDSIDYIELSQETEKQYTELIQYMISHDVLVALVDRMMHV